MKHKINLQSRMGTRKTPPCLRVNGSSKFLKSLAILFVLMLGVGNVWGSEWQLKNTDFNTTSYTANDGEHSKDNITYYSSNVMQGSSKIQFKSNSGYLYNKTAMPGNITKITLSTSTNLTIKVGTSANPSSGTTVSSGSSISGAYTYFYIKGGSSTPKTATITVEYSSGTPLTSPTGLTIGTPTTTSVPLSWTAGTAADSTKNYIIEYKLSTAQSWTEYEAEYPTKTSCTLSGLTANTSYNWRVTAVPTDDAKTAGKSNSNPSDASSFTTAAPQPNTVTLNDSGEKLTEATVGSGVNLPVRSGCDGYTFAGWSKTNCGDTWTTTAPTIIKVADNPYKPASNETLYPIYTKTDGGSGDFNLSVTSGDFKIVGGDNNYATGNIGGTSSGKYSSTTDVNNARIFTFTKVDNGVYTIYDKSKGEYVKYNSSTDLAYNGSATYNWTITANGTLWTLASKTSGRYWAYRNTGVFGGYASTTGDYSSIAIKGSGTTSYISVPNCCTAHNVNKGTHERGGFTATPSSACAGTTIQLTPETVTGYKFSGWTATGVTLADDATSFEMPDNDVTLIAKYTVASYNISYDLNGGAWDGDAGVASYTYGVGATLPTNVVKDNSNFGGWFLNNEGDAVTAIGATETGNKSYTAHWNALTDRSITYVGIDEGISITDKPTKIDGTATSLVLNYVLTEHYKLNSVAVQVGTTTLTDDEVVIDKTNSTVTITPNAGSFGGDLTITFSVETIKFTVKWFVNGVEQTSSTKQYVEGTAYSTVKTDAPSVDDKAIETCANKFMGWATKAISSQTGVEEDDVEWVDEESTITAATNYYAVFATGESGTPKAYTLTLVPTDFGNNYDEKTFSKDAVASDNSKTTVSLKCVNFMKSTESTPRIQFKGTSSGNPQAFLYNTSSIGSITSISGGDDITAYQGATQQPTSEGSNQPYFQVTKTTKNAGYVSSIVVNFSIGGGTTYSNYLTNCCTPLAAPANVAVTNITSTKATISWDAVTNATGYDYTIDGGVNWISHSTTSVSLASLASGANFSVKVRATYTTDDTYCEKGTASAAVPFQTNFLISKSEMQNGSVTVKVNGTEVTEAAAGATVTLDVTPAAGYILETLTYNSTDVKDTKQFTMPSEDVTIAATFKSQYSKTLTFVNKLSGVSGSMNPIAFEYNQAKTLPACGWSKTGYTFEGWATTDGGAKVYDDEATIPANTFSDNANLYAVWSQKTYTIKLSDRGEVTTVDGTFHYGDLFDAFPTIQTCTGYEAFGWTDEAPTSEAWASAPAKVVSYTVQDVAEKTFYAVYREAGEPVLTNNYKLIANSEIESGKKYLLVGDPTGYETNYYAMDKSFSNHVFAKTAVTISNNIIANTNDDLVWTITGDNTNGYSIQQGTKYVGVTNYDLDFTTTSNNIWHISIANDKSATIADGTGSYPEHIKSTSNGFEVDWYSSGYLYLYKQQIEQSISYLTAPVCKVLESVKVYEDSEHKVNYKAGENFDKTGLGLVATFSDASEDLILEDDIAIEGGDNLQMSATKVTAKYTYDGETKSCDVDINMIELKSIAVNSASAHKTTYKIGQTFNPAGLKLDATYNTQEGKTQLDPAVVEVVTSGFDYEPKTALAEGTQEITITYQEKTVKFNVTVEQASAATVVFAASDDSQYMETETLAGAGVKVPSVNDCDDYTFLGWTADDMSSAKTSQPTLITVTEGRYYPEEDVILYPVFKGYSNPTLYKRATNVSDLKDGMKILVYNNSAAKTLGAGNSATYTSALPTETDNQITVSDSRTLWKLTATGENVYKLQYENNTLGVSTLPTSGNTAVSYTTDNSEWTISKYNDNAFHIKQGDVYLEVYSNNWVAYYTTNASNGYIQNRIYVPAGSMIYTSAPSTCTVAIAKSDVILNAGTGSVTPDAFEVLKDESITLPDATFSCAGGTDWAFYGWATESVYPATATAPAKVNKTYTPTEDVELFAVYKNSGKYISTPSCLQVPTFSHEAGEYDEKVTLTLTAGDNSDIYYTTDGSCPIDASGNPTEKAEEYTSAGFELTSNATIAAIAVYTAGQSDMVSAAYTFVYPDAPTFSAAAGNVVENSTVTITSPEGTKVMYKIGDAEYVTDDDNSYTYTFSTTGKLTIKAKTNKGGLESTEESRAYTVIAEPYEVTLHAGTGLIEGEKTKVEIVEVGGYFNLPELDDPCDNGDSWKFIGWAESEVGDQTSKPTLVGVDYGTALRYYPTADVDLYAVYQKTQGVVELINDDCSTVAGGNDNFISIANTYSEGGGVRLGKSGNEGSIRTKVLNVPIGSTLNIDFDYKGWTNGKGANIEVAENTNEQVVTGGGYTSYTHMSTMLTTTEKETYVYFTSKVNDSEYRAFLKNIVITMGTPEVHYNTNPTCCVRTISYNVDGGEAIEPVIIPCGTGNYIALPEARKQDCFFDKWTAGGVDYAAGAVYEYASTRTDDVEFVAHYKQITSVTINKGETKNASAVIPLNYSGTVTVKDGAILMMDEANSVGTFIIESKQGSSGQVKGGTNLTITGDAYMELEIDAADAASFGWYAFTVPFPVSGSNGIYYGDKKLKAEMDYSVMKYLGDVRAQGKYGWKKCHNETLQPGVFYLIAVADTDYKTLRFHLQKTGASYTIEAAATKGDGTTNTCRTNISKFASDVETDAGWNGVGNKTLEYVSVNDNGKIADELQTYDNATKAFKVYESSDVTFSVGKPCFVQASASGDFSFSSSNKDIVLAPARTAANASEKIKVTLSDNAYTDNLFISASEDALPQYEITRDLAKMGATGTVTVPQIATKNYGVDLCVEYAPLINDEATYELSLYAPKAGEYILAATAIQGATLYLYEKGNLIWNLSQGAYTLDLSKGTNDDYTLVLKADGRGIGTGAAEIDADNDGVQKFILDERLVIIRDGKMYNAEGALVK